MKRKQARMSRRLAAREGGAMVELALLMMVMVPLVMLPLYFQDSIIYKLDAQERVFSTAWDFAFGDYEKKTVENLRGSILQDNEEIFKNALSGNKRDKGDPAGPWADFRWPANPVSCSRDKSFLRPMGGGIGSITLPGEFHDRFTNGGLVECQGSIEVANHYIPEDFMNNFTAGNNKKHFIPKDNYIVHQDGDEPIRFGLLVDPWTIHDPDDIKDRDGNEPFVERADYCWYKATTSAATYLAFQAAWVAFLAKATQKKLLSPLGAFMENPPLPMDISVLHPQKSLQDRDTAFGQSRFYLTPHKDGDQNMYEQTYNARKQTYLGCPGALDDGNC